MVIYITNDSNALKYYFTRDTRGKLLHMIDYTVATPKTYFYIHDAHDNVTGMADISGYRIVNYEYDAWGNILSQTGTATLGNGLLLVNENPFRYCEYQFDTETGWYYLKFRYYAPSIARFLTRDPILNLNRYSYAANNPVTSFDPDGFRVMMMEDGGGKRAKIYYHAGTVYQPDRNLTERISSNLQGIDYNVGVNVIYSLKFGIQQLTNNINNYLVVYGAIGTDIGGVEFPISASASAGKVTYFTTDASSLYGLSIDVGGGINTGLISAGYSQLYATNSSSPIGYAIGVGPAVKVPGPQMHVMGARTLLVLELPRFDPNEVIRKRRQHGHYR